MGVATAAGRCHTAEIFRRTTGRTRMSQVFAATRRHRLQLAELRISNSSRCATKLEIGDSRESIPTIHAAM